jgi:hypothetical protein
MDHEVCPTLEGIFSQPNFHGPISKECNLKAFGFLIACKTKRGPREVTMHSKSGCAGIF